jgi:uncharacterized protein YndB with AHSA1/START domain
MNAVKTNESIELEFDLDEPPEKVWQALTEQDLVEQWLTPNDGEPIEREMLEAVPNERVSWRQSERTPELHTVESIVTFELERTEVGTHVRLTHTHFAKIFCMLRSAA